MFIHLCNSQEMRDLGYSENFPLGFRIFWEGSDPFSFLSFMNSVCLKIERRLAF
jgi:hypothetical protein